MSTTNSVVKLVKGTRTLTLTSGRYAILDFVPPPVAWTSQYATGTSANVTGGGKRVSRKAQNRILEFGVNVRGNSEAEIRRGIADIQAFLNMVGDESDPLYLEFNPVNDTPEPLWGQYGANLHYEIVDGSAIIGDTYFIGTTRYTEVPNCRVSLTLKPFALGQKQRLATASGGILEDTIGVADGFSRGLIVPEVGTNLFTNPVFGNSTWNTGWWAGSHLVVSQNTDSQYVLFGENSALITSIGTGESRFCGTTTLTSGSAYALSAYVIRPDRAAVGSADCRISYNGTPETTTYTNIGNGWYRAEGSVTGNGTAARTGLLILTGQTIYADGFQAEQQIYTTPLIYGDELGCAWTSTAHASTSTRTAGAVKISAASDTLKMGNWTLRIVWKTAFANTHGTNIALCDMRDASHTIGPLVYYNVSNDRIYFNYNSVSLTSNALTFSAGTYYIIHTVCDGDHILLYVNGAEVDSDSLASLAEFGANICIGSTFEPLLQCNSTIAGFATFDRAMTATQVADDYANIAQVVADDQRVESVPWLWTKDGDDVAYNHYDAGHNNWIICGGISGSDDAKTEFTTTQNSGDDFYLANLKQDNYVSVSPLRSAQSTGPVANTPLVFNVSNDNNAVILGHEMALYAAVTDLGSGLKGGLTMAIGAAGLYNVSTDYVPISAGTTCKLFRVGAMRIDKSDMYELGTSIYAVQYYRTSGTATITTETIWFPRPVMNVMNAGAVMRVSGYRAVEIDSVTHEMINDFGAAVAGDLMELSPSKINHVIVAINDPGDEFVPAGSITFNSIYIEPRYTLL